MASLSLFEGFLGEIFICIKSLRNTLLLYNCLVEFEGLQWTWPTLQLAFSLRMLAFWLQSHYSLILLGSFFLYTHSKTLVLHLIQLAICLFNSTTTHCRHVHVQVQSSHFKFNSVHICRHKFLSWRERAYTIPNLTKNEGGGMVTRMGAL